MEDCQGMSYLQQQSKVNYTVYRYTIYNNIGEGNNIREWTFTT